MQGSTADQYWEIRPALRAALEGVWSSDRSDLVPLRLNFPELICARGAHEPLTVLARFQMEWADPYFAPLHELILRIDAIESEGLQVIGRGYRLFIGAVVSTAGEEREELMLGQRRREERQLTLEDAIKRGSGREIVRSLRETELDQVDCNGLGPVHLSLRHRPWSLTQILLDRGAPLSTTASGETPLHIAVARKDLDIVVKLCERLPPDPLAFMLASGDQDGKTPLHVAVWGKENAELVKHLLEKGADPNALSKYQYTPAHWAAKHGHIRSLQHLIGAGALINVPNDNGDHPVDLAIRWGQDAVIHLLTGQTAPPPAEEGADRAKYYTDRLIAAHMRGAIFEEVLSLHRLSEFFLAQGQTKSSLKLACATLHLLDRHQLNGPHRKHTLEQIARAANSLLQRKLALLAELDLDQIMRWRGHLAQIRYEAIYGMPTLPPAQVAEKFSQNARRLFIQIIEAAIDAVGAPPCRYAAFCLGSMVRDEMAPFSDVEWGILIEQENAQAIEFFQKVVAAVDVFMICLGETGLKGLFPGEGPVPPNGFMIDPNIAVELDMVPAVVCTPDQLARFQDPSQATDHAALRMNALLCLSHLTGEQKLIQRYWRAVDRILDEGKGLMQRYSDRRLERALFLLRSILKDFQPDFSNDLRRDLEINTKVELYRPIQEGVSALALLYKVRKKNTFERIAELERRGLFSEVGARNLGEVLAHALRLRYAAHTFYGTDKDELFLPAPGNQPLVQGRAIATPPQVSHVRKSFNTVQPWHRALVALTESQGTNLEELRGDLLQPDFYAVAMDLLEGGHWTSAAEVCRKGLGVDPKSRELHELLNRFIDVDTSHFHKKEQFLLDLWSLAAEIGLVRARLRLIRCHFDGFPGLPDPAKGFAQLNEIGEEELDGEGLTMLARCYLKGWGTPTDRERGLALLREASKDRSAHALLARAEAEMESETYQAIELLKRLSDHKFPPAMGAYGRLCVERGKPKFMINAVADRQFISFSRMQGRKVGEPLLLEAAEWGDAEAQLALANLLLSDGEEGEARRWGWRAATQGLTTALIWMGDQYLDKESSRWNASRYYRQAEERGDPRAKLALGRLDCREGDYWSAERHFSEAAMEGCIEALVEQGILRFHSRYGRPNEAFCFFERAAQQGSAWARYMMAECHLKYGALERPSLSAALKLYLQAAKENHLPAYFKAAAFYLRGIGCRANSKKAYSLFYSGKIRGDPACCLHVARMRDVGVRCKSEPRRYEFDEAVAGGAPGACYHLANFVLYRPKEVRKKGEIRRLYTRAESRDRRARFMLGVCCLLGKDGPVERRTGIAWLKRSGIAAAKQLLRAADRAEEITITNVIAALEASIETWTTDHYYHLFHLYVLNSRGILLKELAAQNDKIDSNYERYKQRLAEGADLPQELRHLKSSSCTIC